MSLSSESDSALEEEVESEVVTSGPNLYGEGAGATAK